MHVKGSYGRRFTLKNVIECRGSRHVMRHCPIFVIKKKNLNQTLGNRVSPENIVTGMLSSKENWVTVSVNLVFLVWLSNSLTVLLCFVKSEPHHCVFFSCGIFKEHRKLHSCYADNLGSQFRQRI